MKLHIKRTQVLGPEGKCSMLYLPAQGKQPALISNGHWAVLGEAALRMRASVVETWAEQLLASAPPEERATWELTEDEFRRAAEYLADGGCGCMHAKGEPLYRATFDPDPGQRKLVFGQFLNFDATEQLIRRSLTVLAGVTLSPRGKPEAYGWVYGHPYTRFWVWAEYLPFFMRIGGVCVEYPVGARVVLVKNTADISIGAVALFHP